MGTASTAKYAEWEEFAAIEPASVFRDVHLWLVGPAVTGVGEPPPVDWKKLAAQQPTRPDPDARARMAALLESVTGWQIFPELETDREYVSKLWAEDWDSPEDAIYDE